MWTDIVNVTLWVTDWLSVQTRNERSSCRLLPSNRMPFHSRPNAYVYNPCPRSRSWSLLQGWPTHIRDAIMLQQCLMQACKIYAISISITKTELWLLSNTDHRLPGACLSFAIIIGITRKDWTRLFTSSVCLSMYNCHRREAYRVAHHDTFLLVLQLQYMNSFLVLQFYCIVQTAV